MCSAAMWSGVKTRSFDMNHALSAIIRDQLKRSRNIPSGSDVPLNAEECAPGQASGAILKMEEFQQELLLSPVFTPGQEERAACESVLPPAGLSADQVAELIALLAAETLCFPATVGARSGFCPLPEVVLNRYVRLLALNQSFTDADAEWIDRHLAGADRQMVRSLARRSIWQTEAGKALRAQVLRRMATGGGITVEKMAFVTDFVRTYRCHDESELIRSLKSLLESYRIDSEHPLFNNPALEDKQGESIRSHHCDEAVRLQRVAMARQILEDFGKNSSPP